MMDLVLPFTVPRAKYPISYKHKILSMGSCFAEEIGAMIEEHRFNTLLNPHGILFNSISISRAIQDYINNRKYTPGDLVFENNMWHSMNHHGRFSNSDKELCLEDINAQISKAHQFLKTADWLFITLGSSWAYSYKASDRIVANCHKIPQDSFTKVLLHSSQQYGVLEDNVRMLKSFNPSLKILFTVSPVKYIRDGIIENNVSKAHLIATVDTLCNFNDNCFYFPAYELVTDVLRDYRFYKEDMVHPNEQAIKFVWEHFIETFLNSKDIKLFEEVGAYLKYNRHRQLNPNEANSHQEKLEAMRLKIEEKLKAL